jgi:adenylate cyclase
VVKGLPWRNAGLPPERRIEFRVGIHLGDVVEGSDGDLMGDSVNIAARLEGIADPGGICLSEDAYRQVRDRLKEGFADLGEKELKNIARPVRVFAIKTASSESSKKMNRFKSSAKLPSCKRERGTTSFTQCFWAWLDAICAREFR